MRVVAAESPGLAGRFLNDLIFTWFSRNRPRSRSKNSSPPWPSRQLDHYLHVVPLSAVGHARTNHALSVVPSRYTKASGRSRWSGPWSRGPSAARIPAGGARGARRRRQRRAAAAWETRPRGAPGHRLVLGGSLVFSSVLLAFSGDNRLLRACSYASPLSDPPLSSLSLPATQAGDGAIE